MGNGIRSEDVHLADQGAKQSLERAHQARLKAAQQVNEPSTCTTAPPNSTSKPRKCGHGRPRRRAPQENEFASWMAPVRNR